MDNQGLSSVNELLDRKSPLRGLLQGLSVLGVVIAVFLFAFHTGRGKLETRTLTFAVHVIANLTLIVANLPWEKDNNKFREQGDVAGDRKGAFIFQC